MLANKIKETLDKYLDVEKNYIQREEFENFIKNNNVIEKDIEDYFFKVSAGQGTPAVIPWWGIFNKNVTTKGASQGYYVIFLFKADMSGVYLSLNFGLRNLMKNIQLKEFLLMQRQNIIEIYF